MNSSKFKSQLNANQNKTKRKHTQLQANQLIQWPLHEIICKVPSCSKTDCLSQSSACTVCLHRILGSLINIQRGFSCAMWAVSSNKFHSVRSGPRSLVPVGVCLWLPGSGASPQGERSPVARAEGRASALPQAAAPGGSHHLGAWALDLDRAASITAGVLRQRGEGIKVNDFHLHRVCRIHKPRFCFLREPAWGWQMWLLVQKAATSSESPRISRQAPLGVLPLECLIHHSCGSGWHGFRSQPSWVQIPAPPFTS